ncbi:hypothetical protein ABPG75_001621 [Micractinium tetrahymenae]
MTRLPVFLLGLLATAPLAMAASAADAVRSGAYHQHGTTQGRPACDQRRSRASTQPAARPLRSLQQTHTVDLPWRQETDLEIGEYRDEAHLDGDATGLATGEHSYKYRMLEGLVVPPYVTPARLNLSRTIATQPADVCHCSFPKSGSTWLANILYLVLHDGHEPGQGAPLRSHLHWMESAWTYPRTREQVDALPSPRIFKSHMPHHMALAGGPRQSPCRFIYIARNPKDVCVSYYHFESGSAWSGGYDGTWEHWLRLFMDGRVQRGDWLDHVLSWWEVRGEENMLFLRYEDLKRDFRGQLARIAAHVGVQLSPKAVDRVVAASSFSHMRAAPFSNHKHIADFQGFFRKGEVGSWRDRFTVAQTDAFDRLYTERMADSGLTFTFE